MGVAKGHLELHDTIPDGVEDRGGTASRIDHHPLNAGGNVASPVVRRPGHQGFTRVEAQVGRRVVGDRVVRHGQALIRREGLADVDLDRRCRDGVYLDVLGNLEQRRCRVRHGDGLGVGVQDSLTVGDHQGDFVLPVPELAFCDFQVRSRIPEVLRHEAQVLVPCIAVVGQRSIGVERVGSVREDRSLGIGPVGAVDLAVSLVLGHGLRSEVDHLPDELERHVNLERFAVHHDRALQTSSDRELVGDGVKVDVGRGVAVRGERHGVAVEVTALRGPELAGGNLIPVAGRSYWGRPVLALGRRGGDQGGFDVGEVAQLSIEGVHLEGHPVDEHHIHAAERIGAIIEK